MATPLVVSALIALTGCQALLTGTPEEGFTPAALQGDDEGMSALEFPEIDETALDADVAASAGGPAAELVASWSLEQQVASLFLIHVAGTSLSDFTVVDEELGVAGFLMLGNNIPYSSSQAGTFVSSVRQLGEPDLLVAIDQEGGAVQRLRPDPFPSAEELGKLALEDTTSATQERNGLVFDVGANVNLGIVADVSPGPDAYIHSRSFGTDAAEVSTYVGAALEGSLAGVATAVKHFPGHGLTDLDTHEEIARSDISLSAWFDDHAPPFLAAVNKDVPLLMFGHLIVDEVDGLPASLSAEWVRLVREQWGYDGVLVTDDLSMLEDSGDEDYQDFATNATAAVAAGMDLLIDAGGTNRARAMERVDLAVQQIVAEVNAGRIDATQVEQSAIRVAELRYLLGGVSRPSEDTEAG